MALRLVAARLITLPSAAVVCAAMWWIGHLVGGVAGAVVIVAVLVAPASAMWGWSRTSRVDHSKVNDAWQPLPAPDPAESERPRATAA